MSALSTSDTAQLARLSRIEGQLRGVQKMIASGRYCLEITGQIGAVIGALHRIQRELMNSAVRAAALEAHGRNDAAPLQRCIGELLRASAGDDVARPSSGTSRRSGQSPHACCSVEAPQPRR